jgi:hypothetical protein
VLSVDQTNHQIECLMSLDGETIGQAIAVPMKKKFNLNLFVIVFAHAPYYFTRSFAFGPRIISGRHQNAVDRHGHRSSKESVGAAAVFLGEIAVVRREWGI